MSETAHLTAGHDYAVVEDELYRADGSTGFVVDFDQGRRSEIVELDFPIAAAHDSTNAIRSHAHTHRLRYKPHPVSYMAT